MKKINRKAAQKVSVLCRIVGHIDNDNRVFLFSSEITIQLLSANVDFLLKKIKQPN